MLMHLGWFLVLAQPAQDTVEVRLVPAPGTLAVTARYPNAPPGPLLLEVAGWAGVSDFAAAMAELTAKDEAGPLQVTSADEGWTLELRGRPFTVAYTVAAHKLTFVGEGREDLFRATLLPDFAFAWGHAWWALPSRGELARLPVRVVVEPDGYRWAEFLPGASATVGELQRSVLVAGAFRRDEVSVDGARYRIYRQGTSWSFPDSLFSAALERIVREQARAMGGLSEQGAAVVLLEGSSRSQGGTVEGNVIALYPDPAQPLVGRDPTTLRLVAHEHFHRWNGGRASEGDDVGEGYYKWFQEGMTEYMADLTLLRAGLLTPEGFVDRVNQKILAYLANPVSLTATAPVLAERYWWTSDYRQLPYDKGFLLGLLVDLRLRRLGGDRGGIDAFLRAVIGGDRKGSARYDDTTLLGALGAAGGGVAAWEEFYERYMLGLDSLPLDDLCGPRRCERFDQTVFAWGFRTDRDAIVEGTAVIAVDAEGNAAKAGMQVGDTLTGRVSYWGGDPSKEATIEVARGGERHAIRFFPSAVRSIPRVAPDPSWIRQITR